MIPSIFFFVLVLLIIIFCSYQKRLHLFEILFIWMTIWLITHSVSSIIIVNFKLIALSQKLSFFWVHFFKRLLLYPLIIIMFFDLYQRISATSFKILTFVSCIFFLSTLEFVFIYLGILINNKFTFFHALIEWSFTILLTYLSWIWYRNKRLMGY